MGKKSIHPTVRAQVVALDGAGLNQVEISNQLKISRCCVQNAIKKYKKLRRYDDLKHTGRPKKISDREVRHLKKLVKGDSRLSATKIASDLNSSLPKPVTTRTVRRYLKDLGFEYVVKIKKQWLSARHRQQRVAWCRQHLNWTQDDWRKVIFSDESTFYVLKRKNQCKIWRLEKEKLLPECLQQTNTGDGGKVGIWGGISGFGTTAAKIYTENMNGQLYCDILQKELKRSMAKFPKKIKIIYQQDLAPWHTSKIVKDKIVKLKLNVLDWAPKSPDLNPIEMLWSILDKKLASKPIYSKSALTDRLQQEWNNIDQDLCIKLVESMPERIQKCLKAKGGHFL
jgi:transposase